MYPYDDTEDRHIEYYVLYISLTDIYICYSYWYIYYYSATVQKFKNDRVFERLNTKHPRPIDTILRSEK